MNIRENSIRKGFFLRYVDAVPVNERRYLRHHDNLKLCEDIRDWKRLVFIKKHISNFTVFRGKCLKSLSFTPLHTAACINCSQYQYSLVKILLKRFDYVNVRDEEDRTPLSMLVNNPSNNHFKIRTLKALLRKGADVNAVDSGLSVLCNAVRQAVFFTRFVYGADCHVHSIEVVKILLKHGAKVNLRCLYFLMGYWSTACNIEKKCFADFRMLTKLLIQFAVMQNFHRVFSKIKNKEPIFYHLSDCSRHFQEIVQNTAVYNSFSRLCDACADEFMRMSEDYISSNYSLYQFVAESIANKLSEKISEQEMGRILLSLAQEKYPYCKDMIYDVINYHDLIKMEACFSVTVSEGLFIKKTVTLPPDCFGHLIKFLNKEDVINLLIASGGMFKNNMDVSQLRGKPIPFKRKLDIIGNFSVHKKKKLV